MRVLHLPVNVASHLAVTVRGLRAIDVDARGLVFYGLSPTRDDAGLERLSDSVSRRSLRWAADALLALPQIREEIRKADVVHWYMTTALPLSAELRYAAQLAKPSIVEFAGGDIRNPEIEMRDNPYYAEIHDRYEYRSWETARGSHRTQALFAQHGCEALVSCPSLLAYLEPGRFEHVHMVRQRIPVAEIAPVYPDPETRRPLVVHASTARIGKGTPWVLDAVEQLRDRIDFEFRLLEDVPHAEAVDVISRADVYLDQFVVGAHGGAAIEAMAAGKPVVGYIKPAVARQYPADIPLVNATRETLPDVLEGLLRDGRRRHELGRRSREYAELHHDSVRLASHLRDVYAGAISRRARAGAAASP